MSQVDKQALREAALNAKTAGEAQVMPFDQRIDALNAFTNLLTPVTAIALLDENEALAAENYRMKVAITQQIKLKAKIKNSGTPPHPDFWIQSICEAEDNVLRAISEDTETDAFINEMRAQGVNGFIEFLKQRAREFPQSVVADSLDVITNNAEQYAYRLR